MSVLHNLARLHRWALDEKRRLLMDLERRGEALATDRAAMRAQVAAEREVAGRSAEAAQAFPDFMVVATARLFAIDAEISALAAEIVAARAALAGAFEELKKYELAQEAEDSRARTALAQCEGRDLDEVALGLHRRAAGRRIR